MFFFQFQFPLSTICQCFAWFFANGCDEYLSICVFQHTHSKCCKNHKIPGKVLKLICWCEFLGQNFLELERLTAGGDKGEISLSKVLSERFSLTSSSSILQLQPNFYSYLISYSSILNPSFSNLLFFSQNSLLSVLLSCQLPPMEGFIAKMNFAWFYILWKEKEARYLWNDALWYFHAWVVYSQCLDAFDVYNWRSAAQKPRNRARDWCFGQRQVNRHNSQSMHRRMPSENVQMRWKRIYNTHWRFNSARLH